MITRSFVKKYHNRFSEYAKSISFVMTINSPFGGITSTKISQKFPIFYISSWRDVAKGSAFLQDINEWSWPQEIPYYLIFSYKTGKSDDGSISLKSQIPYKL